MTMVIACSACGATLRIHRTMVGKRGKCPHCRKVITIADTGEQPDAASPAAEFASTVTSTEAALNARGAAASPTRSSDPHPASPQSRRLPSSESLADATRRLTVDEVLAAFQGQIARPRVAWSYSLGIVAAAGVMILIPLIYLALIGLVCYGVYWHLVHNTHLLQLRGGGGFVNLVAYLAPAIVGAIQVAFMFKPLLARSADSGRTRSLTREGEPLLFAFVDRICDAVGAPRPKRIEVDCQVNASARFRRGFLSFLGNDLVLTIGAPLVAGLTMRQLAGVLAHEFGHFSQGAGMRLSYVVRSIAYWLHRVVNERDAWDQWLRDAARTFDIRIGWVFYLAQFFVWLTRKILYVLMMMGLFVAGVLLREMEFDADRYETRLAGSDTFASTSRRIAILNLAMDGAREDAAKFYREGRLADNLPQLMYFNLKHMPAEVMAKLLAMVEAAKTRWFDTHPSDRERIERARQENAPGIFRLDRPAVELFQDFPTLARNVTWDFYRHILGPHLQPQDLHPTDELIARQEIDQQAYQSLHRFFQGTFSVSRPYRLPSLEAGANGERLLRQVKELRERIVAERPVYDQLSREFGRAMGDLVEVEQVLAMRDAGLKPTRKQFPTCPLDSDSARRFREKVRQEVEQLSAQMTPFEQMVCQRLAIDLGLMRHPRVAERLKMGAEEKRRVKLLLGALRPLIDVLPQRIAVQLKFIRFLVLCSHLQGNTENTRLVRTLITSTGELVEAANKLRSELRETPYPFDHAAGEITIATYLLAEPLLDKENIAEAHDGAQAILDQSAELTKRVMAHLAAVAERVETALGLPLLPEVESFPDGESSSDAGAPTANGS
ncbi:MAG: hypothetical protein KatS3mg111_2762 [Pirellulaceae bacterium]|nr:MAG: hypothetical protein KatS3mg111_2762 [Pirellulaceae bacterium]